MDEPRTHSTLMTVLVVTSIVAAGIVVAGLTATPEEPELTVQPVTTTEMPPPPPQEEYVVVTPEVEFPTTIPGCDSVDEPVEPQYFSFVGGGSEGYDNPAAPWFGGPKAHLMSQALVRAFPAGVEFDDGRIPYFDPIPAFEDTTDQPTIDSTSASASVTLQGRSGYVSVGVAQDDEGVPACVAGSLDERTTLPDGTVVDTDDTWQEVNGERSYQRSASAYRTDGSRITAYSSSNGDEGALPLTLDHMVRIVTEPALATSVTPPPGTPGNSAECGSMVLSSGTESTGNPRSYTISDVETLDSALQRADVGALQPSPPLGSLRTSPWGSGLCQVVNSAAGSLTITVGDTVQPDQGRYRSGTTVSVPTPSGLGVTVVTENPWDPAALEQLARTPGLDLP